MGDWELSSEQAARHATLSPFLSFSLPPFLPFSLSPYLPFSLSPFLSPSPPLSLSLSPSPLSHSLALCAKPSSLDHSLCVVFPNMLVGSLKAIQDLDRDVRAYAGTRRRTEEADECLVLA